VRILLTNDDGVDSPGLRLLAAALRNAGHRVFALAPDINRSGTSHSISFLSGPCKLTKVEDDTWSSGGTPADCVIFALLGGLPELCILQGNAPDLILSGINCGANLGTDIIYSGTAAAARQGSFFNIPSIALSLVESGENWHWEPVISFIVEKLDDMKGFWKKGTFINVNFPNSGQGPLDIVRSFPSQKNYNDRIETFVAPDGELYCFARIGETVYNRQPSSDWDAIMKNNAALSVVISQPVSLGEE